jgi:hypothetical protein
MCLKKKLLILGYHFKTLRKLFQDLPQYDFTLFVLVVAL